MKQHSEKPQNLSSNEQIQTSRDNKGTIDNEREVQPSITTQDNTIQPQSTINVSPVQLSSFGSVVLTDEQELAVSKILDWYKTSPLQEFKLGGYAGTGKTTIIKTTREKLKDVRSEVCAFTGKAAHVLQKKGIRAGTIHSLIYDCESDGKGGWIFNLKSKYDFSHYIKLIIVDEASMVSSDLYRDLKSFGIKILWVGDPGQLEPVGENPRLMVKPNFVLSKIHRQAEQSPIISFATQARQGNFSQVVKDIRLIQKGLGEPSLVIRPKRFTCEELSQCDQVLCARNKTKDKLNGSIRDFLERRGPAPVVGEKIMVLRNNLTYRVFNGMILFVKEIKRETEKHWECICEDEEREQTYTLPLWKEPYLNQNFDAKKAEPSRQVVYSSFAYAITVHKSQGSEWDKVCTFDEFMSPNIWDMAKWRYTAITRASESLLYLV